MLLHFKRTKCDEGISHIIQLKTQFLLKIKSVLNMTREELTRKRIIIPGELKRTLSEIVKQNDRNLLYNA